MPPGATLTGYDQDVVLWANEQAALLRAGRFAELDIANIAEEIEDVGKAEQRELASHMAVLLMHLLKWAFQSEKRTRSWLLTIGNQRHRVHRRLRRTPSLKALLADPEWQEDMWIDATQDASKETGLPLELFPRTCPWSLSDVLAEGWLPEEPSTPESQRL